MTHLPFIAASYGLAAAVLLGFGLDAWHRLGVARRRLGAFQADPQRHAWHGMKVLVKYHLLEVRQEPWSDFVAWFTAAPMSEAIWARLGRPEGTLAAFGERTVGELVDKAVLARRDGWVLDA